MISDATLLDWMKADAADTATLRLLEQAAIKAIQKQTGRYWGATATITETVRFKSWPIVLANEPTAGAITSLSQWSGAVWEVVTASDYYVDGTLIWPNSSYTFPNTFGNPFTPLFKVIYPAGYAATGDVWAAPEDIQMAVKLLVGHWYENRESVVIGTSSAEIQQSLDWLLDAQRRVTV